MSSPSMPAAPDPAATAAATAAGNKATAISQYGLSATNQRDAAGNTIEYTQLGNWPDATPHYQATQTYSPGEQQIYNTNLETRKNVGDISLQQSGRIGDILNTPFKLDNAATEGRIDQLARARLDPQWATKRAAFDTKLSNQGITDQGSEAYINASRNFGQQENDAYNQMYLTGRQQANQELLTERNQPINEISALMSGSQVSNPSYASTPNVPVQPTDTAKIYGDAYNAQVANYNAANSRNNAMMGGVFGIGSSLLGLGRMWA